MKLDLQTQFAAMARNTLWSNHRLHTACDLLSEIEYFKQRPCFFGTIHATLAHIVSVDQLYFARLKGTRLTKAESLDEETYEDLKSVSVAQQTVDRSLVGFCDVLDDQSLARVVRFTNTEDVENADPVAHILSHLFVHQIHHRGQVHDMLSATSVAPPQLDEFFLSGDLPRRRDELAALGFPPV